MLLRTGGWGTQQFTDTGIDPKSQTISNYYDVTGPDGSATLGGATETSIGSTVSGSSSTSTASSITTVTASASTTASAAASPEPTTVSTVVPTSPLT